MRIRSSLWSISSCRRPTSTSWSSSAATRSAISTAPDPLASWPDHTFDVFGPTVPQGCDSDAGPFATGRSRRGGRSLARPAGRRYPWVNASVHLLDTPPPRSSSPLVRGPSLTTTHQACGHGRRMPAAEPRYCVAEVTEEARDGWRDFADRYDVDRTALAEVIGLRLGAATGHLPPVLERWVREAKELKNERRRRG